MIELLAFMFLVTIRAVLCLFKAAVQPLTRLSLLGHIGMTPFTAPGFNPLEGDVTLATVSSKVGMARKSTKLLVGLGNC